MEGVLEVETITPEQAAKIVHKSTEFIRALLRQNKVDWGTAAQGKTGQWNYLIIKSKFLDWVRRGDFNEINQSTKSN